LTKLNWASDSKIIGFGVFGKVYISNEFDKEQVENYIGQIKNKFDFLVYQNNLITNIMEKGTHGINEKTFEELSYADQARSLNANILDLERALNAHLRKTLAKEKNVKEVKEKYILQLKRLINGLN